MDGSIAERRGLELDDETLPATDIFQSEIGQRRDAEDDHEKL